MKLRLLIISVFLFSLCSFSQELYPILTKKLVGCTDSSVVLKVDKIYKLELNKNPKDILLLKLWKFTIYDSLKNTDLEDPLCTELLPNANSIPHRKAALLFFYKGTTLNNENDYKNGIQFLHKGVVIARKFKDLKMVSILLKEIGVSYRKINNLPNAIKYLNESLAIAVKIKNDLQIATVYLALGNALREKKDDQKALKCFEKSLPIALKLKNAKLIAGNYNNIGLIEENKKNHALALKYFDKALKINIESGNKLWQSFNYHNIGNVYDEKKDNLNAIKYYALSIQLKIELGDSLMILTGYLNIGTSYYKDKSYKMAYDYLNKYVKLKDTLNLKEQTELLNDLEAKYESDKKLAEIKHLKVSNELQNVKNDSLNIQAAKNKNILILSVLSLISLIIGIGILFITNKRRKNINKVLFIKNNEIEESNDSLQHALNELSIKNKEVIDSISYATYIQQAALPNISQIISDQLRFELLFSPKDIVSGDFYFSYQLYNKTIFGVADCTGHGVPGAMVSLIGMNSLDKVVREEKHEHSSLMVDSLNNHVQNSLNRGGESTNDGMDISFCYLNHEDNVLHFTGANHNAFILRKKSDFNSTDKNISLRLEDEFYSLIQLSGARRPIGKSISEESFYEVNFQLLKRDRVVLFSDGFADQTGELNNKKLKKGAMLSMLLKSSDFSIKDQILFMKNGFESWKGSLEQVDDVCLLIVELIV